jgi:hypothetical protein
MDLRHEFASAGCRRLLVLVQGLPPDAAWRRDGKAWTSQLELAAALIEQMDRWGQAFLSFMSGKKTQVPAPLRLVHEGRPAQPDPQPVRRVRHLSVAEFAAEYQKEMSA